MSMTYLEKSFKDAAALDSLRHMLADLPDARSYARWLETSHPEAAEALRAAYIGSQQPYAGVLRVAHGEHVKELRTAGLIDIGGLGVGAFGNKVRKYLLGEMDDG